MILLSNGRNLPMKPYERFDLAMWATNPPLRMGSLPPCVLELQAW